jgi:hypothetical protein
MARAQARSGAPPLFEIDGLARVQRHIRQGSSDGTSEPAEGAASGRLSSSTNGTRSGGYRLPPWGEHVVQGVADVLGATETGLSGSEIGRLLGAQLVPDPGSSFTKRLRLGQALLVGQRRDGASNCVVRFINDAMTPVRYHENPGLRTLRQDALNEVLVFEGLRVLDDGRIGRGSAPALWTRPRATQQAACRTPSTRNPP